MSKIIFTEEQQDQLRKNKYVEKVSSKSITYTDEFKGHAIAESESGMLSTEIFREAGFDINVIGSKRAIGSLDRWKRAYKQHGELGLRDTRKTNSGRPLERTLTLEEIIVRKNVEIEYLKMELEIQKKFDMIERRALKKINKNTKN